MREAVYTKRDKLRTFLNMLWKAYKWLCVFICTVIILYVVYAVISYSFRYVELPNGVKLKSVSYFSEDLIVLKNKDGDILAGPDVVELNWNDKYLKGYVIENDKERSFIYKIGDSEVVYYSKDNEEEYYVLLQESGLSEINKYYSYLTLVENASYRRKWYQ